MNRFHPGVIYTYLALDLTSPGPRFSNFFQWDPKKNKNGWIRKNSDSDFFGTMKLSFPNSDRFLWKSRCFFFGAISVFDFPFKPGNTWAKFGEFMTGDFAIFASDFVNFSKGFDLGGKKPKMFFLIIVFNFSAAFKAFCGKEIFFADFLIDSLMVEMIQI